MGAEKVTLLILHLLGASVWIGGLVILAIGVAPKARKEGSIARTRSFESSFHILGMVAITLQFLTGFRLAMIYVGGMKGLFDFSNHGAVLFLWKLVLILVSMAVFVVFKKKLKSAADDNPSSVSPYVWIMMLLSVALMVLGLGFSRGII
jgi:putative copper export protein